MDRIRRCLEGRGLVEVGAGAGYWASLLAKDGVDVMATDHVVDRNAAEDSAPTPPSSTNATPGGVPRPASSCPLTLRRLGNIDRATLDQRD